MSAPTYFTPFERFVDGGTTTYNNPTLAAVLEAVQYGPATYSAGKLSVLSFGTGCRTQLIAPEQVPHPPGPDTPFWLAWLMTESGNDASDMQSDLFRATALFSGCGDLGMCGNEVRSTIASPAGKLRAVVFTRAE